MIHRDSGRELYLNQDIEWCLSVEALGRVLLFNLYYNLKLVKQGVYRSMKDLKNLVIYGGLAGLMVLVLALLGRSDVVSGGVKVTLALILVVVVPLVLGILMARKERREKAG